MDTNDRQREQIERDTAEALGRVVREVAKQESEIQKPQDPVVADQVSDDQSASAQPSLIPVDMVDETGDASVVDTPASPTAANPLPIIDEAKDPLPEYPTRQGSESDEHFRQRVHQVQKLRTWMKAQELDEGRVAEPEPEEATPEEVAEKFGPPSLDAFDAIQKDRGGSVLIPNDDYETGEEDDRTFPDGRQQALVSDGQKRANDALSAMFNAMARFLSVMSDDVMSQQRRIEDLENKHRTEGGC